MLAAISATAKTFAKALKIRRFEILSVMFNLHRGKNKGTARDYLVTRLRKVCDLSLSGFLAVQLARADGTVQKAIKL